MAPVGTSAEDHAPRVSGGRPGPRPPSGVKQKQPVTSVTSAKPVQPDTMEVFFQIPKYPPCLK